MPKTSGGADSADGYNNFHEVFPIEIKYKNKSGGESSKEYKGFGYAYNMYDPIVKCRKWTGDCTIPSFSVGKAVNNPSFLSYKVFIPPGTRSINIRMLKKSNNDDVGAVVRYGRPPEGSYRRNKDLGKGGKVTLGKAKNADSFSKGKMGRGQVYILKQDFVPAEEVGPNGGWLYFKILARAIGNISVLNNVQYEGYMKWVESWSKGDGENFPTLFAEKFHESGGGAEQQGVDKPVKKPTPVEETITPTKPVKTEPEEEIKTPRPSVADGYNNFHVVFPIEIKYKNESGGESSKKYKGFGYAYNMYDPIVKCRKWQGDCTIPSFSVEKAKNNPSFFSYRVFIPPGTRSINIRLLKKSNNDDVGAVVRYGRPPEGSYRRTKDLGKAKKVTLGKAKSADSFSLGKMGRGQVYIIKQGFVPAGEVGPNGGWLYFKILARAIGNISVSNNVDYKEYMKWVESWCEGDGKNFPTRFAKKFHESGGGA